MFKVRASYGELGNENIGEYMYQAVMSRNNMTYNFNGNVVTGSAVSTFVDSNLAWEKKKTYNVGIDLALFRATDWSLRPSGTKISAKTFCMRFPFRNKPVSPTPP